MLEKNAYTIETNILEELLFSIKPEDRQKVLKFLKKQLINLGIKVSSASEIITLAEENLTLRAVRYAFEEALDMQIANSDEVKNLKAYYLTQRFSRVTAVSKKMRRLVGQKLRKALVKKGILSEEEVKSWRALTSPKREERTLYYAANYLGYVELENVFNTVLAPKDHLSEIVQAARNIDAVKNMNNREILPFMRRLLSHDEEIPAEEKREVLETIIDRFISDHFYYKIAARSYLTMLDIYKLLERRICLPDRQGKIGQKAAGMILAHKILITENDKYRDNIHIPESFYLTSDVFYETIKARTFNFASLKHRLKEGSISDEDLENEFPKMKKIIMETEMPDMIRIDLRRVLEMVGYVPVIVRSSSLLEDSASSFSGKYDSFFFANQQLDEDPEVDIEKRVDILIEKILMIYSGVVSPEVMIYRRERGLLDEDERMSVLIQVVEGKKYGKYFFPAMAGVGLSYNNRVNTDRIKWDDPVLRIGVGLGTGVVDIKNNQFKVIYPVAPDFSVFQEFSEIVKASQRNFDVLNLETDEVQTITKHELFDYFNAESKNDPAIKEFIRTMGKYFLSTSHQDYLTEGIGLETKLSKRGHIVTLGGLKKTEFYHFCDWGLRLLSKKYQPADMEFTVSFDTMPSNEGKNKLGLNFTIVQCRQLTDIEEMSSLTVPENLPEERILCTVNRNITNGYAPNIEYIVYVNIDKYFKLQETQMYTVARLIGKLNSAMKEHPFILIGPGRWGSSNPYQGIKAVYSEIYNTRALVEVTRLLADDRYSEASLGSHFGNDIRESRIVTMSIYPGMNGTIFRKEYIDNAPNLLDEFLPKNYRDKWADDVIKVVNRESVAGQAGTEKDTFIHLISNSSEQKGIIFLDKQLQSRKTDVQSFRRPVENTSPIPEPVSQ